VIYLAMAVSLLISPLLSFLVEEAGKALIEQFCQLHGMKKNHRKLKRQLLGIQRVISNAEDRAKEPLVEAWLTELNAVAYKAVDVLDDFRYEVLRREAHSQDPSSSIRKV
jgi:Rx N-terminal domain